MTSDSDAVTVSLCTGDQQYESRSKSRSRVKCTKAGEKGSGGRGGDGFGGAGNGWMGRGASGEDGAGAGGGERRGAVGCGDGRLKRGQRSVGAHGRGAEQDAVGLRCQELPAIASPRKKIRARRGRMLV